MDKTKWYVNSLEEVSNEFDIVNGLNDEGVKASRQVNGENKLDEAKGRSLLNQIVDQFKDTTIIILLVAVAINLFAGSAVDSVIILAIIILNAVVGVVQEGKAEKSLKALQDMSTPSAKVIRNGQEQSISSKDIVVGDLMVLDAGDLVAADIRITDSKSLKIQEASLTGESVPVDKFADIVCNPDAELGDRKNMAYSSGMVSYGRGQGVVTAVGMQTEVGKIATMLQETKQDPTPLQKQLNDLGKILGVGAILACTLMFVVGFINGVDPLDMFLTAISLAVAVVPEGLPAVATIVLAMGVNRLVDRHAIVRNLPSVETLGSASVICSDKTGTLTQNIMTVQEYWTENDVNDFARGMLLCNDSRMIDGQWVGDPTETALSAWAATIGLDTEKLLTVHTRLDEVPFDSGRKRMSTINDIDGKYTVFVKGGVDEVLAKVKYYEANGEVHEMTPEYLEKVQTENKAMGVKALRVLSLAYKIVDAPELTEEEIESDLIFVGLVGMIDPPRPEVTEAIRVAKHAGIRVVMITGDHMTTAEAIGREIGLLEEGQLVVSGKEVDAMSDDDLFEKVQDIGVYARVSPEHKMRIISAWKRHGHIVAMTGDGVNDAPALKRADIGAAMGIVGTEVAKSAADMVLTDDNFATVVVAVEEGRRIKDNIMKAISYLLSCNVGELVALLIAILMAWDSPLLPIHLLWVNLVTDSLPALALGVDNAEDDIMDRHPDMSGSLINKSMIWRIAYQGFLVGGVTLIAYMYGMGKFGPHGNDSVEQGRTMAFIVLAFTQLIHSYSIHSSSKSALTSFWKNKWLVAATLLNGVMILGVLFIPVINDLFQLGTLDGHHWIVVGILMFIPFIVVELMKLFKLNGKH